MKAIHLFRVYAISLFVFYATAHASPAKYIPDPHSFSRPWEVRVTSIHLDLTADFSRRELRGTAQLHISNARNAEKLYLDTNQLVVEKVTLGPRETETTYSFFGADKNLGKGLAVDIRPDTSYVTITYRTTRTAPALQWVSAPQTFSKKHPFLFTQSEPHHARSWIPCQDSPQVRITYTADIHVPQGVMAVMSAANPTALNDSGVYRFSMQQRIPSYLIALAVGDLAFAPIGKRTGIYADPAIIHAATHEFSDVEHMFMVAELLYGRYRWGRFDILVLPSSFPFGGMENPRLTFVSPALITGDRSLTPVIAHELAHAWSGNLVTNATWNEVWLNEGFTTYLERRIFAALYGRDEAEMMAILGGKDLEAELVRFAHLPDDSRLRTDFEGRDPDLAINRIPYEKGYLFLRMLEEKFGRVAMDQMLAQYFDGHAFQSMTTERFLKFAKKHLTSLKIKENLWDDAEISKWVDEPGLPDHRPMPKSEIFEKVENEVARFNSGTPAIDLNTAGWRPFHWMFFLSSISPSTPKERLHELETNYHFSQSRNAAILTKWFTLAATAEYEMAYPAMSHFLSTIGRVLYIRPVYSALMTTEKGRETARQIFSSARKHYHPLTSKQIGEVITQPCEQLLLGPG